MTVIDHTHQYDDNGDTTASTGCYRVRRGEFDLRILPYQRVREMRRHAFRMVLVATPLLGVLGGCPTTYLDHPKEITFSSLSQRDSAISADDYLVITNACVRASEHGVYLMSCDWKGQGLTLEYTSSVSEIEIEELAVRAGKASSATQYLLPVVICGHLMNAGHENDRYFLLDGYRSHDSAARATRACR